MSFESVLKFITGDLWKKFQDKGMDGKLIRGATGTFTIKILGALLGFILHIILARSLGVEEYGTYTYYYTWVYVLAILCRIGFTSSLVRFVPEYITKKKWGLLKGIFRSSFRMVATISFVITISILIIGIYFPNTIGLRESNEIIFAVIALPFFALLGVEKGILRGMKKVVLANLPEFVIRRGILILILMFYLLNYGENSLSSKYALFYHSIVTFISFTIGLYYIYISLPTKFSKDNKISYKNRKWIMVSIPLLIVTGMNLLSRNVGLIMTGAMLDHKNVGLLGASIRISNIAAFVFYAVNMIAGPLISELYYENNKKDLQLLLKKAAWGIFIPTVIIFLISIGFGNWILTLFGLEFSEAYIPFVILMLGQVVNSCTGPVGDIMFITGYQNQLALLCIVSFGINIILCLILIPIFKLVGAAISVSLSISFLNIAISIYILKKLSLNTTIFYFKGN